MIDFAERPRHNRQIGHRGDSGVWSEAKGQIIVAARPEQGERAFQMLPRLKIVSGEVQGDAVSPMRDAGLRGIGGRLDVAEEGRRARPHQRQFASRVTAGP